MSGNITCMSGNITCILLTDCSSSEEVDYQPQILSFFREVVSFERETKAMITVLPTYCLHGVSKYAQNTDLDELYAVLFYKSWHLLTGGTDYITLEFQLNNQFSMTEGKETQYGKWKIVQKKQVVLKLHGIIYHCHLAFYDGSMLILKVFGQRSYIVMLDSYVFTPRPHVTNKDIEAYLHGNKKAVNTFWNPETHSLDKLTGRANNGTANGTVNGATNQATKGGISCLIQIILFIIVILSFLIW